MPNNHLKLDFPSLPQNVGLARVIVAAFATQLEFTLAEVEEIRVAVSEAVSNCVIHAYPEMEGMIELKLIIESEDLIIRIKDFGIGIDDVEQAKQATFSTDSERMGLGLVFIESFMDSMEIISGPGLGTTIIMKKRPERGLADVGFSRSS